MAPWSLTAALCQTRQRNPLPLPQPRPPHLVGAISSLFALSRRPGATLTQGLSLHGPAHGHGHGRLPTYRTVRMERDEANANAPLHRLVSPCRRVAVQSTPTTRRYSKHTWSLVSAWPSVALPPTAALRLHGVVGTVRTSRQVICTRSMSPNTNAARHMLCRLSLFRFMYLNGRKDGLAQSALALRPERAA